MKRTIILLTIAIALLTAGGLEAKPISVVADEETYKINNESAPCFS